MTAGQAIPYVRIAGACRCMQDGSKKARGLNG